MDSVKLPKFKWDEISELNSGHTPEEWGSQKKKTISKTFVAYTIALNV